MSKENTKTTSQGGKTKKFKMPKFPPALVILFFVLFFVVLLSWIPHKGWVDTSNPLFYFTQEGIFGSDGVKLAEWNNVDNFSWLTVKDGTQINFMLTQDGADWLNGLGYGTDYYNTQNFNITGVVLGDDWSAAAINYSSLSFNITTESWGSESLFIEFDKIFAPNPMMASTDVFTFNVLSVVIEEDLTFVSENIADNWFNFFNTNYFVGDSAGRYGILNLPFIMIGGIFYAAGVILFLLCIGGFIRVVLDSGALDAGTASLVNKLKGKELLLIPILFVLMLALGTAAGMQEAVLGLIPLIVPFLILAGFDAMTGLLIIVVGTCAGIGASVLNPFSVGTMAFSLEVPGGPETQASIGDGIVIRIIEFITFAIVGSVLITWYGNRSRKGKDYSVEPEMYEANKAWAQEMLGEAQASHTGLTKRQAIGLAIFAGTFGIMLFALLPWLSWIDGLEESAGWQAFSSLLFAKALFGKWYFIQLAFLFLIAGLILGKVFGMKQKETNKALIKGGKEMAPVALILAITRAVALVLTYSGLTTGMIAMMFGGAGGEGDSFSTVGLAWILFPMFSFLACFIPSTSGLAGITGPLIAPMIWQLSGQSTEMFLVYATVALTTYPLAQGIINMSIPSTGLVVVQADLAKVNFGKAFKLLALGSIITALLGMIIISVSLPIMSAGVVV